MCFIYVFNGLNHLQLYNEVILDLIQAESATNLNASNSLVSTGTCGAKLCYQKKNDNNFIFSRTAYNH